MPNKNYCELSLHDFSAFIQKAMTLEIRSKPANWKTLINLTENMAEEKFYDSPSFSLPNKLKMY